MSSLSALVVGIRGIFEVVSGIYNLLFNGAVANARLRGLLSIENDAAIDCIALGSITIGAFYIAAAIRRDRGIMWATVADKAMAVLTYSKYTGPWKNVVIIEAVCGLSTALALLVESWREDAETGKKDS